MINKVEIFLKMAIKWLLSYYEKITDFISKRKKIFIFLSIVVIGLLIWVLNCNTPMAADDYSYSFIFGTTDRVTSIADIFKSQVTHYMTWGGRSIVHFIAQVMLMISKTYINILNTAVFLIFVFLIYLNCNYGKKTNLLLFLGIFLLVWFGVPAFGQAFLWVTGSANYMYGITIVLAFLLMYKIRLVGKKEYNHKNLLLIPAFIFGVLAGWTNENTAAAAIVIVFLYLIQFKRSNIKINRVDIIAFIGLIIGFVIMIAAPGNYVRAEEFKEQIPFIITIINRIVDYSLLACEIVLPLVVIYFITAIVSRYQNNKLTTSVIFFIGTLAAIYSMILSPDFPYRAWTGVIVYIIIAIGTVYAEFDENNSLVKNMSYMLLTIFIVIALKDYWYAFRESSRVNYEWNQRIEYIESEKGKGNLELEVYKIAVNNKYCGLDGLADLSTTTAYWTNENIRIYFGLDKIVAKEW